ncbi:MAG: hypothetical protein JOZ68_10110, partial [Acidimicrobiia bacterium]|nr:hypothetical protein [Acidimicrobiia bacterium]
MKTRTVSVWGLTALLTTAAALIGVTELRHIHTPTGHTHVPWLLVAVAFYLAEAHVVHVYRK